MKRLHPPWLPLFIVLSTIAILASTWWFGQSSAMADARGAAGRRAALNSAMATTFFAVADATIKNTQPTVNFGGATTLTTFWGGVEPAIQRAAVRFDLSSIPANAVIDHADLVLRLTYATGDRTLNVSACLLAASWSERSLTWNNQPAVAFFPCAGAAVGTTLQDITWDVTAIARSWLAGPNYGLELSGPEGGSAVTERTFGSREYGDPPPRLIVTYSIPGATPTTTSTRTSTPTATATRTSTATPPTPSPIPTLTATSTLSAPEADADSTIDQGFPSTNAGASTLLAVGRRMADTDTIRRLALLRFDLGFFPPYTYLADARLELYQTYASSTLSYPIGVRALTAPWQEMQVTWANAPGNQDVGLAPVAVSSALGWKAWNVTALVREWKATPSQNFGLVLTGEDIGERAFSSREGSHPPRLFLVTGADTSAPDRPANVTSLTHTGGQWSNRLNVVMQWSAPIDWGGSGVRGYSTSFNSFCSASGPENLTTTATQFAYDLPGDGIWCFHVRAVDWAGNWSGDRSWGPIYIDTQAPTNPTITSSTHTPGVWSNNPTVLLSWSGGTGSDVAGYSTLWDGSPTTDPGTVVNATGTSATSTRPEGTTYFHLRTKDVAGNWSAAVHFGPILVDTVAPDAIPNLVVRPDHGAAWGTVATKLSWVGGDGWSGSGVDRYEVRVHTEAITEQNWANAQLLEVVSGQNSAPSALASMPLDTMWHYAVKAVDKAGNWSPLGLGSVGNLRDMGFRPYPQGYGFINHGWAPAPYLNLAQFISACGGEDCISCWYRATIWFSYWYTQSSIGLCEGMSVTSEWFLEPWPVPISALDPLANFTWAAHETDPLLAHIVWTHALQVWDPTQAQMRAQHGRSVADVLNETTSRLFAGAHIGLPVLNMMNNTGGHTVAPYALQQESAGQWRIYIYDPNYPGWMDRWLELYPVLNIWYYKQDGDYGSYSTYPELGVIGNELQATPVTSCNYNVPGSAGSADAAAAQIAQVFGLGAGRLLISDAQGRRLGFDGDQWVSEIPDAWHVAPIDTPAQTEDPVYALPLTRPYHILLDGKSAGQTGQASVSQISEGRAASVEEITVDAATRDQVTIAVDGTEVRYEPGSTTAKADASVQHPTLTLALDGRGWGYSVRERGIPVSLGQSIALRADVASGRMILDGSRAGAGGYDLEIKRQDAAGRNSFVHRQVPIATGDTHFVQIAAWDGHSAITLQVDQGSDGTVDETVTLRNQLKKLYLPLVSNSR